MPEKICSTEGCGNVVTAKKRSKCAKCLTARHLAWRNANIEKARAAESEWRQKRAEHLREYEKKPERREKQNAARRRRLATDAEARAKNAERAKQYYLKHRDDPEWRKKNNARVRTPEQRLKHHLKKRYKLTVEEYNAMVLAQGGLCAVCKKEPNDLQHRLSVDHNHTTGEVRELLCRYCNHVVSILEDKADLVMQASLYITRHARTE